MIFDKVAADYRIAKRVDPTGRMMLGLPPFNETRHAPALYVMLASGVVVQGMLALVMFTVLTTSMAFVFTRLFNNTRASLLLCILLHGSVDGSITYLQVLADRGIISADAAGNITGIGMLLACIVLALLLVALTRGWLSYPRYQREAEFLDLRPSIVQKPAPRA